ncbi:ferric reductase family protein [Sporobolomyces koalae]|uniref:ferric reductase family protein n=1 Tax=Sporobolomyces koalae TaxID=500713 RepID=UPI00316F4D81
MDAIYPHPVSLKGGSPAVKLEKTRQKIASLHVTNIYIFVMAGVLGFFILRNVLLIVQRFFVRRQRKHNQSSATEKSAVNVGSKPFLLRLSDRVDSIALRPCKLPFLPQDWTYLQLLLTILICAANIACCIVVAVTSPIPNQAGSSVLRAFSRRCGRVAIANFPILYCFAGRNNVIATLTGISYQELRFYHILIGGIVFLESWIHTWVYLAHYWIYQPAEVLREEYSELYFKMGIVAIVFMLTNCVFGLKWIRRRSYEIFLTLHIVGGALILAGMWYHRPINQPWVYAAAAVWVFERLVRLGWHVSSIVNSRLIVRKPLIQAKASVVAGAIKLTVPFPGGDWQAGQHAYLTFWGSQFLRSPWFLGQPHPFSISNVPIPTAGQDQALRFVLRVHKGITKVLARQIEQKCKATGQSEVPITVGLEGPHGWAPEVEEFDSVLLVAGGSGITHPLSVLADACQKASQGSLRTSRVKLVWALHRSAQLEWIRETIEEAHSLAAQANVKLDVEIYITRSEDAIESGVSTPTDSPSLASIDEKKEDFGATLASFVNARQFSGRPDIAQTITEIVSESAGSTLVVACGPSSLANEVRYVASSHPASSVQVQIASFEC